MAAANAKFVHAGRLKEKLKNRERTGRTSLPFRCTSMALGQKLKKRYWDVSFRQLVSSALTGRTQVLNLSGDRLIRVSIVYAKAVFGQVVIGAAGVVSATRGFEIWRQRPN
jgi:hypothetical protein